MMKIMVTLRFYQQLFVLLQLRVGSSVNQINNGLSRRTAVGGIASSLISPICRTNAVVPPSEEEVKKTRVFQVVPDWSENLSPHVDEISAVSSKLNDAKAIWLGEHHNSISDHLLQAQVIRNCNSKNICIGLEAVQQKYQSVLDEFSRGRLSLDELRRGVEWDRRWVWPFERYVPALVAAKEKKAKLLALNVNSEDLEILEKNARGLNGLDKTTLLQYVLNPQAFAQFAKTSAFAEYVRYVVEPSYEIHRKLGILRNTVTGIPLDSDIPLSTFFAGRLLQDEAMASRAASWYKSQKTPTNKPIFIGLIGSDHVKFSCGVPARFSNLLNFETGSETLSILLNPSPYDTSQQVLFEQNQNDLPPFVLQIRFASSSVNQEKQSDASQTALPGAYLARQIRDPTQTVLPLADLLLISGSDDEISGVPFL